MIVLRERKEGDVERFENALWDAKAGIKEACEIFEDMKEQFSERGSYGERYSNRGSYGERYSNRGYSQRGGGYSSRDWDEMDERRYRDSMGRFR